MQMALAQLAPALTRALKSLYLLHGDEALLQQEAADLIRQTAKTQGFTERSVHIVQGAHFKWAEVLQSGMERSLFSDQQLVEIRIPSGKPGKEGGLALQKLCESVPKIDGVMWLVLLPRVDFATQKTAWFAALESAGTSIKIDTIERRALPAWIGDRLRRDGMTVASGDEGARSLQFFADRVEGNLLAAHQEVSKLSLLYAAKQPTDPRQAASVPPVVLSFEQIEQSVLNVARFDVFKLTEAVLSGQLVRVQRMLDGLRSEGQAEVLVHYTLAEEVRALRRVKMATSRGKAMGLALRENRVWGPRESLYERIIPRLSAQFLDDQLAAAQTVDGIVKGLRKPGWPANGWAALQQLAQGLAVACAAPEPSGGRR